MKMFSTLSRFIYQPEPPQPTAAPFDDGLAEIARLIAREDPVKADALSAPTVASSDLGPSDLSASRWLESKTARRSGPLFFLLIFTRVYLAKLRATTPLPSSRQPFASMLWIFYLRQLWTSPSFSTCERRLSSKRV